jgi:hypothetical protein
MSRSSDNPVVERMDRLHDQWTQFCADGDARILRWRVEADELPLLEAFVARESDAAAGQTSDLFLETTVPFTTPHRHGLALGKWLVAAYDAEREALRADGVEVSWQALVVSAGGDVDAWVGALSSLADAYPAFDKVAVWLRPESVADPAAYALWLQRLAQAAPPQLRFIVVDGGELEPLARHEPRRVRTEHADLDVPGALEDISAAAGNLATPGGRFRHLYVQIAAAAKSGEVEKAQALGAEAIAVAEDQGWHHLAGTVHFLVGSLLLQSEPVAAVERFFAADRAGAAAGEPYGRKMRLQARLSAGTALLTAAAFAPAAEVFTEAVPFAQVAEDPRAELDAWRLACYCHEHAGEPQRSWEAGLAGLRVAKAMDAATRESSTLRYLADAMLRLTEHRSLRDYGPAAEHQLAKLFGIERQP